MVALNGVETHLVGSSRKRRSFGLAANSTPIVRSLRCSTFNPSPGTPTIASAKSSMLNILITSSTYAYFSWRVTLFGWRSSALKRRDSRTVAVSRCRSGKMSLDCSGGFNTHTLLLHVTCFPLKALIKGFAIDEHVSSDDAHRSSLSEDVE